MSPPMRALRPWQVPACMLRRSAPWKAFSEALAQEVAPLGIKVTLVEPGAFRTEFLSLGSIRRSEDRIEEYDQTAGKNVDHLATIAGEQAGDPARCQGDPGRSRRGAAAVAPDTWLGRPSTHARKAEGTLSRARHLAAAEREY